MESGGEVMINSNEFKDLSMPSTPLSIVDIMTPRPMSTASAQQNVSSQADRLISKFVNSSKSGSNASLGHSFVQQLENESLPGSETPFSVRSILSPSKTSKSVTISDPLRISTYNEFSAPQAPRISYEPIRAAAKVKRNYQRNTPSENKIIPEFRHRNFYSNDGRGKRARVTPNVALAAANYTVKNTAILSIVNSHYDHASQSQNIPCVNQSFIYTTIKEDVEQLNRKLDANINLFASLSFQSATIGMPTAPQFIRSNFTKDVIYTEFNTTHEVTILPKFGGYSRSSFGPLAANRKVSHDALLDHLLKTEEGKQQPDEDAVAYFRLLAGSNNVSYDEIRGHCTRYRDNVISLPRRLWATGVVLFTLDRFGFIRVYCKCCAILMFGNVVNQAIMGEVDPVPIMNSLRLLSSYSDPSQGLSKLFRHLIRIHGVSFISPPPYLQDLQSARYLNNGIILRLKRYT